MVACKDFLNSKEVIFDYNSIKNEYDENIEEEIEKISSSSSIDSGNDLEKILIIIEKNSYFKSNIELKERFWNMFVIDAFIGNNDRNEGNWGLVVDRETKELRIAPVYDNGVAFFNKASDTKLNQIYNDEFKFKQSIYESAISIYRQAGKPINPLKFIESMVNKDCNEAILRIVPKINLLEIQGIFNELPEKYNKLPVLSKIQKDFYMKALKYKYEKVLLPIYNKLTSINNTRF